MTVSDLARLHTAQAAALHLRNYWREERARRAAALRAADDEVAKAETGFAELSDRVASAGAAPYLAS
jgi:hypothetical protein